MEAIIHAGVLLDLPTASSPPLNCALLSPLVSTPPSPRLDLSVIIPARDEEACIADALIALTCQVDLAGRPLDPARYEVIVLANNCRDATAAAALAFGMRHPRLRLHVVQRELPPDEAHVGRARRMLMDESCRRFWLLRSGRDCGVIASTDADTRVGPTWVAAILDAVARGADAVGGRIVVDPCDLATLDPDTRAFHLRDVGYRSLAAELESRIDPDPFDPWPRHFQHFGASIAVTAEAYARIGGLPVRPWLEDISLVSALLRVDARLRHDPRVRVTTSARTLGRTVFGFAGQLGAWSDMSRQHTPFLVESVAALEERVRLRVCLRGLWRAARRGLSPSLRGVLVLANGLGVDAGSLLLHLSEPLPFGALYERVLRAQYERGVWSQRWPSVAIEHAIPDLRARLAMLRSPMSGHLTSFEEIEPVAALAAAD